MKKKTQSSARGYAAIGAVLLISAVSIAIAVNISQLSIGEGQSGLALQKGEDTLRLVESCTEDALMRVQKSPSYTGNQTVTLPQGTCSVVIVSNGTSRDLVVTNTSSLQYVRKIHVVATRNTKITITTWEELQ